MDTTQGGREERRRKEGGEMKKDRKISRIKQVEEERKRKYFRKSRAEQKDILNKHQDAIEKMTRWWTDLCGFR